MSKRRTPYQKKLFESDGSSNDVSANIYRSMMESQAWMDLTAQQKILYTYCKLQLYAEKRKPTDDPATFTMNRSKWLERYHLYNPGNERAFYRDMAALIEHGFVICLESGAVTRTKSVYRLSSMWQKWGTSEFDVPVGCMTPSMAKRRRKEKEGEMV